MRALLLLAAVPTAAFAPISALDLDRARDVTIQPGAVRVQLESGDVLAFLLGNDVVTQIDLRVRGVDYSVPLECAGGLRDVKFDSAVLSFESTEVGIADRSFSLLFDVGQPVYDRMPRIQLGFYRRRLTQMIRMEPMGETGGAWTKLCEELPAGPVTCEDTRELTGLDPYTLVSSCAIVRAVSRRA